MLKLKLKEGAPKAEAVKAEGSGNVAASAKRMAAIKGDIGSRDAFDYLRGALEIVKAAGYAGLVIVIDEAETILRMRKDSRHKSLNGIRQIADAAGQLPHPPPPRLAGMHQKGTGALLPQPARAHLEEHSEPSPGRHCHFD